MMKKMMVSMFILSTAVFLIPVDSYAQDLTFTAGGGITSLTGDGSEYWNMGFHLAGQGFYALTPNILVGGRVAYNRITPNEDEILGDYDFTGVDVNISGSGSVIELLPSVRVQTSVSPDQNFTLFGQGGLGMYFSSLEATVEVSYLGFTYEETVGEDENNFGICFGGGASFAASESIQVEILPLYHIVFTEEETSNYFTVSVNIVI